MQPIFASSGGGETGRLVTGTRDDAVTIAVLVTGLVPPQSPNEEFIDFKADNRLWTRVVLKLSAQLCEMTGSVVKRFSRVGGFLLRPRILHVTSCRWKGSCSPDVPYREHDNRGPNNFSRLCPAETLLTYLLTYLLTCLLTYQPNYLRVVLFHFSLTLSSVTDLE